MILPTTFLFAATTTLVNSSALSQRDQEMSQLLARWSGGNIGRFSEVERTRFMAYVKGVLVTKDKPRDIFRSPSLIFENDGDAYVWSFRSVPGERYIVLLNPHTGLVPSAEHAWLFVVDRQGSVLERSDFDTGWRMYAKRASYETVDWLSSPVLVQEMEPGMNGGGPRKIYIGFAGMSPAVIRLEDASGHLRPMDYFAPNWVVGPKYDPRSIKAMEEVLAGENEVSRLKALVWLAGCHGHFSGNRAGYSHEATSEQRLYAKAIKAKGIVDAIKRLRGNRNHYLRELAEQVPIGVGRFNQAW